MITFSSWRLPNERQLHPSDGCTSCRSLGNLHDKKVNVKGADEVPCLSSSQPPELYYSLFLPISQKFRKDIESKNLGVTLPGMSVTASALYAMDDMGGFDEYILRSHPAEMRSSTGEKIKNLMYYYKDNPEVGARPGRLVHATTRSSIAGRTSRPQLLSMLFRCSCWSVSSIAVIPLFVLVRGVVRSPWFMTDDEHRKNRVCSTNPLFGVCPPFYPCPVDCEKRTRFSPVSKRGRSPWKEPVSKRGRSPGE